MGGGIPIIDPLKHSLIANEITSVMGIVNGTTNYMLTRMADNGLSYEDALHEGVRGGEVGFVEADHGGRAGRFDAYGRRSPFWPPSPSKSRVTLGRCVHRRHLNIAGGYGGYSTWATSSSFLCIAHRRIEDGVVCVHPTMILTN